MSQTAGKAMVELAVSNLRHLTVLAPFLRRTYKLPNEELANESR